MQGKKQYFCKIKLNDQNHKAGPIRRRIGFVKHARFKTAVYHIMLKHKTKKNNDITCTKCNLGIMGPWPGIHVKHHCQAQLQLYSINCNHKSNFFGRG